MQRNVTLENENKQADEPRGKPFACPLCGVALPIGISQKQKPYCVCNVCGIQLFFRGKAGIKRLQELLRMEKPVAEEFPGTTVAVSLYNRLEQLKQQRKELENKQGLFLRDRDLDNAITAIGAEIRLLQSQLEKARKEAEKKR